MSLFDSASLIVTPNGYKEDKLYSIKPSDGSGDLVVTRATTATRVNSDGLIEVVPYNLLQYSEQFDNALWTKVNTTITANTTISPDGTQDADTMSVLDINSRVEQTPTIGSGTYTFSVYVKVLSQTTAGNMRLQAVVDSANSSVIFTPTNEWQKVTATYTATSSINSFRIRGFGFGGTIAIWGAQLVTGTSAKEYFPTTDRLDVPRLDYTNSSCPSILVEPQRTNLALYSEQFDNAYWTKDGVSLTSNATTAPDGTTTADLITESATSGYHRTYKVVSISGSGAYSFFVKSNGVQWIAIGAGNTTSFGVFSYFDIINGTLGTSNIGTSKIENYGNGWFRCTVIGVGNLNGTSGNLFLADSNGVEIYTGDGVSGAYIWGAQLEAGSYATSYVPTVASSVTRNADVISKTGISSLIGQTEGTIFVEMSALSNDLTNRWLSFYDTTSGLNNNIEIRFATGSNLMQIVTRSASGGQDVVMTATLTNITSNNKIAVKYDGLNWSFFVNGTKVANAVALRLFDNTLGTFKSSRHNDTNLFNGKIKILSVWKTPLTDTELAQLTTI